MVKGLQFPLLWFRSRAARSIIRFSIIALKSPFL
jgi:hypothetical protein